MSLSLRYTDRAAMADSDIYTTVSKGTSRPRRRAPADAIVRVVYPAELARDIVVSGGDRVVLGRKPAEGDHGRLKHPTVSRSHFAIQWDAAAGHHTGADLGSHNGSHVDWKALPPQVPEPLADGSILQIGDVIAVYQRGRGVGAAPVAHVSRERIPGDSAAIRLVRSSVARAAPDPSPVLLVGETGTGKEWIANEIHALSGRAGPLVALNCAALSPQLVESQLFGHVRGAFTGATTEQEGLFRAADGGTLFLDEVAELPMASQVALLRVLQEREVRPVGATRTFRFDVRVIAATNRDLSTEVEAGAFRRDLYARIALWEIRVPPVRERRADVFGWIHRLYQRWLEQRGGGGPELSFSPEAAELIMRCPWTDNLRGIDRLIHALAASSLAGPVQPEDLPEWVRAPQPPATPHRASDADAEPPSSESGRQRARRPAPSKEEFAAVLDELGGNVRAMAKHFGRDRRQIYRWLEAFGLSEQRNAKRDE